MSARAILFLNASCLLLTGCLTPFNTRMPDLFPRHPRVEKRAYEFHDPCPDSSVGPETDQRPPGFNIQRTEPRRAWELKSLQQIPPAGPVEPNPQSSQSELKYRNVVRP